MLFSCSFSSFRSVSMATGAAPGIPPGSHAWHVAMAQGDRHTSPHGSWCHGKVGSCSTGAAWEEVVSAGDKTDDILL